MRKVFIIHGFEGSPNGGWRPWLMGELQKKEIYACALSMPKPQKPICKEWVEEISRYVKGNINDEIDLVGHSLGVPAILRFLETFKGKKISRVVLVSGPCEKTGNKKIDNFLNKPFDFKKIKTTAKKFTVIHGDNDPRVSINEAHTITKALNAQLIIIKNGGHLNGSSGRYSLPECLGVLLGK